MILFAFLSMGFTEIMVIATVALLVFGGELPDVMRNVGRAYGRLRSSINEVARPVREELRRVDRQIESEARATRQATSLRELRRSGRTASSDEADGGDRTSDDPTKASPSTPPTPHYPEDPAREGDIHPLDGSPQDDDWDDEPPPI